MTEPRPLKITVGISKRISHNYQGYEAHITEEWQLPVDATELEADILRQRISKRLKKAVNEELGRQYEETPAGE